MPNEMEHWSLTTLREKLVKTGAKVVHHICDVTLFVMLLSNWPKLPFRSGFLLSFFLLALYFG